MISPLVGLDLVMLVVSTVGFGLGLSAVWENWSSESAIRCLAGTLVWSCVLAQFGRTSDCWLDLVVLVLFPVLCVSCFSLGVHPTGESSYLAAPHRREFVSGFRNPILWR
jgi:hypothetical protein